MKQDKHLDEEIRKALESLEASADPFAWDSFEQKLNAAERENLDFDAAMRSRLGGLEAPAIAGDWSFMANRLDAEDAAEIIENEATIDNLAYEKLAEFTARYQAAHWRLMSERIEKEFSLRHKLYRYKVMEAAVLLLLLLTIVRVAPLAEDFFRRNDASEPNGKIQLMPTPPTAPQASADAPASEVKDLATTHFSSPAGASASGKPLAENFQTDNFSGKSGQKNAAQTSPPGAGDGQPGSPVGANFPAKTSEANLPFIQLDEVNSMAEQGFQLENIRVSSGNSQPSKSGASGTAKQIEAPKGKPIASNFGWETPAAIVHPFKKGNRQLRFTILTTSDLNIVNTPPDKVSISDTLVTTDPNRSSASGYGGGILVSLKSNRMEFQTGGVYSFKRYMPGTSDIWWESVKYYVKEGFDGIQLDIFQLPLNLQYHFKNAGNWRTYASVGVSGHVVTSSAHEFGREHPQPLIIPTFGQEIDRTIRQTEEQSPGVLNGGAFQENFYLTGNLGFGIERFVSPRWSLFFQPNYQHNLMSEGIGVNKDKIYSLSFHLGTKVSLK